MHLKFQVDTVGEVTTLAVTGEVDIYSTPQLREQLMRLVADEMHEIIVDLRGVSFMDSTGIGTLIGGFKRARENGGRFDLIITRPSLLQIFRITGLTEVFAIHSSMAEAFASRRE